jgi:hypothetical protein
VSIALWGHAASAGGRPATVGGSASGNGGAVWLRGQF